MLSSGLRIGRDTNDRTNARSRKLLDLRVPKVNTKLLEFFRFSNFSISINVSHSNFALGIKQELLYFEIFEL